MNNVNADYNLRKWRDYLDLEIVENTTASRSWKWTIIFLDPETELQKDFFIRYPDFQPKDVRNMYCLNFATIWHMLLNKSLFSSQVYSFGVELCHKLTMLKPFDAIFVKICSNYLKISGYPSRNVRYHSCRTT